MSDLAAQILYEDNHLLILNKRAGQLVQGDKTGDICLADEIRAFLKERDNKQGNVFCGVVHRLDRPVSGVVVFAKTSKALARMNDMVQKRLISKIYWAITKNAPPQTSATLRDMLVRDEKHNKSYVTKHNKEAKEAILDYQEIAVSNGGYHLLEIHLHTGRHHQIRCQLAHIGCPIRGDLKYGAPRSNPNGGISLHAHHISFEHPVSHQPISVEAPWNEASIFGL